MAKVRDITKAIQPLKNYGRLTDVDMEYSISIDGQVLALRTFGSDTRQEKGKASQAIHLDKSKAKELAAIIGAWANS